MSEITFTVVEKVITHLPGYLLKRYYSADRLRNEVLFETSSERPLMFNLGTFVPMFSAIFTVTNLTTLTWKVLDFTTEIQAWGETFMTARANLRPEPIKAKTIGSIFAQCYLNEFQVNRLTEHRKTDSVAPLTIDIDALFESKIGVVAFNSRIASRRADITGSTDNAQSMRLK